MMVTSQMGEDWSLWLIILGAIAVVWTVLLVTVCFIAAYYRNRASKMQIGVKQNMVIVNKDPACIELAEEGTHRMDAGTHRMDLSMTKK